ncbi:NPC intracellular cholesterol transporter 2 [Diachasma alloeum]|uniref:NPC intracellular cholesterol transporter 2 n=1 Tax=Diachasma alloeum TaxID=454923 RepID=UPI0007384A52|nr:NPC intracellular cholesterol transporter 2 [Diachasma alloeum]
MLGLKVLVIVGFCVAASLQDTPFTKCKSGGPAPEGLRVKGCDKTPCKFAKGTNVEAEWDFNVVADTDDLKPIVKARALGITVNYPLPEQDACKSLTNGECPLEKGELISYGLKMPILKAYPNVDLHLTFSLVDQKENVHVCFELDARVVN